MSHGERPLKPDEAAQLALHLSELARAELPLAPGLRALAEELAGEGAASRKMVAAMEELAERIEAGAPLETALSQLGGWLPSHLRGLLIAGIRSGRLADALAEYVEMERTSRDLRRDVIGAVAYPLLIFGCVLILFLFLGIWVAPAVIELFEEFDMELPLSTHLLMWILGPANLVFALLLAVVYVLFYAAARFSPGGIAARIAYALPLVGPVWYYQGLSQLTRLSAMLVAHQTPLPDAFRWTAGGLREQALAAASLRLADRTAAGAPLSQAVAEPLLPGSMRPILVWGETHGTLSEALDTLSEMYAGRARLQCDYIKTVLPPLTFIFVMWTIGLVLTALMTPLFNLIRVLI